MGKKKDETCGKCLLYDQMAEYCMLKGVGRKRDAAPCSEFSNGKVTERKKKCGN